MGAPRLPSGRSCTFPTPMVAEACAVAQVFSQHFLRILSTHSRCSGSCIPVVQVAHTACQSGVHRGRPIQDPEARTNDPERLFSKHIRRPEPM